MEEPKAVLIDYTNYRGERKRYRVRPVGFDWGTTQYHTEPQWLMRALDLDRQVERTFAMKDVHSWKPAGMPELIKTESPRWG